MLRPGPPTRNGSIILLNSEKYHFDPIVGNDHEENISLSREKTCWQGPLVSKLLTMARRGRLEKPRKTDLGRYIQRLRVERRWDLGDLANAAGVPYRTISKLELNQPSSRSAPIILKVATALDVHPDRLLKLAALTAFLKPLENTAGLGDEVKPEELQSFPIGVTQEERDALIEYLEFLRFRAAPTGSSIYEAQSRTQRQ